MFALSQCIYTVKCCKLKFNSLCVMMVKESRYSVLVLIIIALSMLVLCYTFSHRHVLDGDLVIFSPAVETISSKGYNGTRLGLLSIHLVVIPYLHYNTYSVGAILEREKEYKTVLQRNLNHGLVSRVHVLTTNVQETLQRFSNLSNQNKLVVSEVKSVELARDPFEYISQNLVGKDVMFANADIYLGGGFDRVDPLLMSHQKIMYALSRRVAPEDRCNVTLHISGNDMCLDYRGSHDVFLFRLSEPLPEPFLKELEFVLIRPGLENIVMWLFQNKLKYCTLNPCTILETFHLHCTNVRNHKGIRVSTHNKSGFAHVTEELVCHK